MWIARDMDGRLHIFGDMPVARNGCWVSQRLSRHNNNFWVGNNLYSSYTELESSMYPEITYNNSPVELKLNL